MSDIFKDRLMSALHSAVQNFNESGDPNAAVIKSAAANDFNVEQTTRLVETFNTARTIYHYKTAADRSTPFALADGANVITNLFKSQIPQKSAQAEAPDYTAYERPESDYTRDYLTKAADETVTVREYADTSLDAQCGRAFMAMNIQRDLSATALDNARMAATKAAQLLTKLASELKVGYEDKVQDRYGRLIACYRDTEYIPVTVKLAEHLPSWVKAAECKDEVVNDLDLEPYKAILKEAHEYMQMEAELLAYSSQLEKEARAFERDWLETVAPLLPKLADTGVSRYIDNRLLKEAQYTLTSKSKGQGFFSGAPVERESKLQLGGGKGEPNALTDALIEGAKKPLSEGIGSGLTDILYKPMERENKALSERLKNVQRQIMMEDLLTNDPVLADEEPQTVINAYDAVMKLAPDMSMNKEVVRAILRQAVHSVAIDPYAAQSWTELEKNIRNIAGKGVMPSKPAPVKG